MKKSKSNISNTLKRYYLSFILITFLMAIAASSLSYTFGNITLKNFKAPRLAATEVAQADYKNIYIKDIEKLKGWVEIIQNGKVVFVLGNKADQKLQYTIDELKFPQDGYGKKMVTNFSCGLYSCSASLFSGNEGKEYVCLVKIPMKNMNKTLNSFLDINNPLSQKDRLVFLAIIEGMGIFSLLFMICVIIFTKSTSRSIQAPLKAISQGIERMSSGDYGTRLSFEAESEFAAIRDIFNYMADKLETAEKEKREAEESKKLMIMGISHDLKTPITTVYGYAKALNEGMVEDEAKRTKYLQYICDKAESMTKLIDDLFEYAKLDSGKYQLKREKDDFAEFIRELIAANFIEITNKGFQLELDIPESSLLCEFDRNEMQRALMNILNNCLKYNPVGTTIGISIRKEADQIVLMINDNGVGISQELKDRIFNEFVRGNAARQSDGGSGLGLTITKRIIEMHGGRIEIAGDSTRGSAFMIYLPEYL